MEIYELLKSIRGKDSLREASKKTGLSHAYISMLEKGVDPRSNMPLKPTPETLKAYSQGYHYPYEELMKKAGYMDEQSEDDETLLLIKEVAQKFGLSPSDPLFKKALSDALNLLAIARQKRDE